MLTVLTFNQQYCTSTSCTYCCLLGHARNTTLCCTAISWRTMLGCVNSIPVCNYPMRDMLAPGRCNPQACLSGEYNVTLRDAAPSVLVWAACMHITITPGVLRDLATHGFYIGAVALLLNSAARKCISGCFKGKEGGRDHPLMSTHQWIADYTALLQYVARPSEVCYVLRHLDMRQGRLPWSSSELDKLSHCCHCSTAERQHGT